MKAYSVTITGDKYPSTFNVRATSWSTAIGRAVREWQKRFKGSRTETLSIRAVKANLKDV